MKVVIAKVDDRNAERIMRTEIQDRFVIKSPPTDFPKKKMEKFRYFRTGLSRYILLGVLLTCYKARVTSVEYNKVPEKAYVFTFAELGSF